MELAQVPDWVNRIINMEDFIIVKCSDYMKHAIDSLDVGEESVAESFALRCSFDKSGNIRH